MHERTSFAGNGLLKQRLLERSELFRLHPEKIYPWWWQPCAVKVLLLADGSLNFGQADFGLSTFVSVLKNDGRSYVRFDITVAHRSEFVGDPGVDVARSIPNFLFTDSSHFTDAMYSQVWFFGIASSVGGLSDAELRVLSTFMNNGGGVFATGDHGELGRSLCGQINRVRSMRRWTNASGAVGMTDGRRNDTNQIGHDAPSQFDDQSDDIPQPIQPKLFSSRVGGFLRETYPHPLLCSHLGRITVLPDHPHEGECIEPDDLTQNYIDGTPEYPMGIAPEVIAFSTVPAGNVAGAVNKTATQTHTFGAICAYDGHRAGVGRVVTDATWHHFVNVNLVGELNDIENNRGIDEDPSKLHGFLASASGMQHFERIKQYYVNIAVWISRSKNITCFNTRLLWQLVFNHRVLEATMDNPDTPIGRLSPALLYTIGSHALDVVGRKASQCRRLQFVSDILQPVLPQLVERIDPWWPNPNPDPEPPLPWFDYKPLAAVAIGAGLVAMREKYGDMADPAKIKRSEDVLDVFEKGAQRGIDVGLKSLNAELKSWASIK